MGMTAAALGPRLRPKPNMLAAALWLAERGLHVFALRPRATTPITMNGRRDATTAPDAIAAMWAPDPDRNIAVATGGDVVVVDVCCLYGRDNLERQLGVTLPVTPEVITPRGAHLYFAPGDAPLRTIIRKRASHPSLLAEGGYVLAPPSVHPRRMRYVWAPGRRFGEVELAPLPAALLKLIRTS